jgi:hypothetical protein
MLLIHLVCSRTAEVCIAPLKGSVCGDPLSFAEGDMKFSIFGKTSGTNYNNSNLGLTNGVHSLGFRMRYAIVGATSLTVKFNADGKSLDDVSKSYENIKSFVVSTPEAGDITVCAPHIDDIDDGMWLNWALTSPPHDRYVATMRYIPNTCA